MQILGPAAIEDSGSRLLPWWAIALLAVAAAVVVLCTTVCVYFFRRSRGNVRPFLPLPPSCAFGDPCLVRDFSCVFINSWCTK
jgi:hypothetical protein